MMINSYRQFADSLRTKRLILFGAGSYFMEFVSKYGEFVGQIECVLDNQYREAGLLKVADMGIRVIPPQSVAQYDIRKYVILFCSRFAAEMKKQLDEYIEEGYEYYVYPLLTLDEPMGEKNLISRVIDPAMKIMEGHGILDEVLRFTGCSSAETLWEKIMEKKLVLVPRLVVVLTERCTLRCKECDNLMRHFKTPKNLNAGVILDSLHKIIDVVDVLPCCELIGGEPFLADSMGQMLDFLLGEEKVMQVEITTNGTVLPKQEDISLLRNSKVTVRLSDYGNVIDQSRFIDYMNENKIKLEIMLAGQWIANGSVEKRKRGSEELLQQCDRCYSGKICKTLWEDKLFLCARAASLAALGYIGDERALKVNQSQDLEDDIWNFLCNPSVEACHYCDTESGMEKMTEPAEQVR